MSELYKPKDFQTEAIVFGANRNYAGLFLEPGLGKTAIALSIFKLLRKHQGKKRALVVAPRAVMLTSWPDEVEKWDQFKDFRMSLITGTKADRLRALAADADLYVIAPGNLQWLVNIGFRRGHFDVLFVDESTKFKGATSKRLLAIAEFLATFSHRYIMTGTPTPKSLHDIWGQIFLLDGGYHLGRKVTHFRDKFFHKIVKGKYIDYEARDNSKMEVQELIKDFCISMKCEDHIDMPELVEYEVLVDLPAKIRPLYREMENELFVQLDKGKITAANAGVKTGKLHQIAQGAVYLSDDPFNPRAELKGGETAPWEHIHDAKLDRLDLLLDELEGQQVIVAYEFKHDKERLLEFFKTRDEHLIHLGAGAKDSAFKKAVDAWNGHTVDILMVQTGIVSHGLNIQYGGHHIIMFANTFNFENYDQLRRRLWRSGQQSGTVMVHRIVTRGTVDRAIINRLSFREDEQNAFVKALQHYRQELLLAA